MQYSNYHRVLRVSAVVVAVVLLFESGLVSDATVRISQDTHLYLANAIGMTAKVQPTELNQLTAALTAKEKELAAREAALSEREIAVDFSGGADGNEKATYLLASILFILLVLILLNYVLDYIRIRDERTEVKTV
ncbi:hypothetical protein H6784_00445 [Candidatus Nomurabacteria bacterium]|nr:hypothetical protein [Candidatus Kaiserbacteria bacterium]MCB9813862.1 hypothetical protein [Candidatus Nomurabacteria bacterium]